MLTVLKAMKATMPLELQDDGLMDDSDDVPSDLGDEEDGDEDEDEDGEDEHDDEVDEEDSTGGDDDAFSLAEGSDAEDLIPLDEIPDGLIDYDGPASESDAGLEEDGEWAGLGGGSKKRKREEDKSGKRKKKRSLPTFASYEDYAKLIEDGPEDNI